MSRFPRLTETFVLSEILAMKEAGVEVELFPLLRERSALAQPESVALVQAAHYQPFLSPKIGWSNLRAMMRSPRRYVGTLAAVVRATWRSANYLVGGLAIYPKVVHNALEMRRIGVDHVHCHFANHPALAGFITRRLVGIPYSFTAHGSDLHVDRRGLKDKVADAAFVVAISDYNRRLIIDECGDRWANKVEVIHCGVRTDRFALGKHAEQHPTDDRSSTLSIVCIGTLHEVKGQRYLIEACRILREEGVQLRCVLVGEGEDRTALERQIESAGLVGTVLLAGARTQSEIIELLRAADLLVAPSVPTAGGKREGIPVVLMEAMSCGVPVVASDLSGIPELVVDGRTGLLAEPGSARSLAEAIRRMAQDPALRHMLGAAGRIKVAAEFDVRSNARQLATRIRSSLEAVA